MTAPLKLYNTRTRKLEIFTPLKKDQIGLYSCGPTVYAPQHIGNMRYFIFVDVLKRTLGLNGYTVKHVMNITDVGHLTSDEDTGDDKMELSARRQNTSAQEIANQITDRFLNDLRALNVFTPDVIPFATKTIDLQIALIQRLEAKGITYKTSDGIYFDTSKFPRYGELSGQKAGDKQAGARVEVNDEKRHPTDFALWKFSKPEDKRQMEWPSPWGVGWPGWHIECSAMSMKELGEQFDIHTGGVDHIAVHHENEIAQSEAATGKHPFVNIWMHGEFLKLPGKRMGKSEGNSITLQEVIDKGIDPLAYRFLVLQSGYRKPLNFSLKALESAERGLQSIWNTIVAFGKDTHGEMGTVMKKDVSLFTNSMNDDLNTARALAGIQIALAASAPLQDRLATVAVLNETLGLDLTPELAVKHISFSITGHESMLEDYEVARQEKRYAVSDKIRAEFAAKGLIVEDLPDGTSRLRKKLP